MGFRQNLLKASPFQTYFIPALILFVIVGGSALIASMAVFRQHRLALKAAFMSGDYSHLA